MDPERIAVLGAGSVRCMPSIAGAFASYFGERPQEIRLFDGDVERLDLFHRFCGLLFTFNRAGHTFSATLDPVEAIESVDRIVLCVGQNCAAKYFRTARRGGVATGSEFGLVEQFVEVLMPSVPDQTEILSLLGDGFTVPFPHYRRLDWPEAPSDDERASIPHQVLRFLNGEDYPHALLSQAAASPLKAWLEDVGSVQSVLGRRES